MGNKVFVIEGLCGSGKTVLCNHLKEQNKFKIFDENILTKNKEFSIDEQLEIQNNFFDKDYKRLKNAKSFDGIAILERDFLSTLSFCYALYKTRNEPIFLKQLRQLESKLANLEILPDAYIYLDAPPEVGYERVCQKKLMAAKHPERFSYPSNTNFYTHVQEYNKNYLKHVNAEVYIINANKSERYTLKEVLKVLK